MNTELPQLGALAIIVLFAIKEGFAFLKSRKNPNSSSTDTAILNELRAMNNNHLHSVEKAINDGNARIVEAITNGNIKMIELLGEIKGNLNKPN